MRHIKESACFIFYREISISNMNNRFLMKKNPFNLLIRKKGFLSTLPSIPLSSFFFFLPSLPILSLSHSFLFVFTETHVFYGCVFFTEVLLVYALRWLNRYGAVLILILVWHILLYKYHTIEKGVKWNHFFVRLGCRSLLV